MKFLLTADLHSHAPWYCWLAGQAGAHDCVAIAGDLFDGFSKEGFLPQFTRFKAWREKLNQQGARLAYCGGNHDGVSLLPFVHASGTALVVPGDSERPGPQETRHWIEDGESAWVRNAAGEHVQVTAIPYAFDNPNRTEQILAIWQVAAQMHREKPDSAWLVLHHEPPRGGPTGGWLGSESLNEQIKEHQPDYVMSGHLHARPWKPGGSWVEKIGSSWCFNAGQSDPRWRHGSPNHILLDTSKQHARWIWGHPDGRNLVQEDKHLGQSE